LIIVNDFAIAPLPVACGLAEYPEEVIPVIKDAVPETTVIDAFALAKKTGNPRSMNVVLIGALAKKLNTQKKLWFSVIENRVPRKTWDVNKQAFELGFSAL